MSLNVFLAAYILNYPEGGGHFWLYLNWALSLRVAGCKVFWLETYKSDQSPEDRDAHFQFLKTRLQRYGFEDVLAFLEGDENTDVLDRIPGSKDLLIDINFKIPAKVVKQFRRSILVELDPGLNQVWLSKGHLHFVPHDFFFTIGETVGKPDALFPDGGIHWHYTRPPVYLPYWTAERPASDAPYTTLTQWWGGVMNFRGKKIYTHKRAGFLPYLELPRHTSQILELAINLTEEPFDEQERQLWVDHGWRIKRSNEVASSPEDYQNYIRNSLGEFSCAKPAYVHFQTAWISDRTICYLASGRPAIVEYTGPSSFLPDAEGIFRFRNLTEAVDALERVAADYEQQSKRARALAEDAFDGEKIVKNILQLVM